MRYTKAIRDYVNEELTKKRLEADENDPLIIAYNLKRNMFSSEANLILNQAIQEIVKLMDKYNFELNNHFTSIINFRENAIGDDIIEAEIHERKNQRYNAQKKIEREIEVQCTLGADRKEFMEMLANVKF